MFSKGSFITSGLYSKELPTIKARLLLNQKYCKLHNFKGQLDSFLFQCCPLFRRWLYGKTACGLERILCTALVISLPNDNFFNSIKFKAFAEDNYIVTKMMISVVDRVENIVVKGNTVLQHFRLFPQSYMP